MSLTIEHIIGKLPDVQHHFSTLIFNEGKYFELKPSYHRKYPSTVAYKKWWQLRYQKNVSAGDAIVARALSVLRRSKVRPVDCKYMTTAKLHNNHMRHVCEVELLGGDFAKLLNMGVLKPLHHGGGAISQGARIRQMIYGLIPFTLLEVDKAA